ncbi:MAG: hypothetical protein IT384_31015 [Deltaproteobacteria bacterium]|nr:hypothetical protein [Deltaproteobacteria bacterium]
MASVQFGENKASIESDGRIMDRAMLPGASLPEVASLVAHNGYDDVVYRLEQEQRLRVLQADHFEFRGGVPQVGDVITIDGHRGRILALGLEAISSPPDQRSRWHTRSSTATVISALIALFGFVTAQTHLFIGGLIGATGSAGGGAVLAEREDAEMRAAQGRLLDLQESEKNFNGVYGE